MPDFNIDDILSDFKGGGKSSPKKSFDIDDILSDFKTKDIKPEAIQKTLDNSEAKPPRPEDFANSKFEDVPKTKRSLPTTSILESIGENYNSSRETFSSGLNDIASNKPASGVGKAAMGALGVITSPVTGLVEGGLEKPLTDITGNPRIGKTAGIIAEAALPVVPIAKAIIKGMPKNKALSTLVENIGAENLPAVVAGMKSNPRLGPADLSPRVLQDAQHLFANEGKQIDYLSKTSADRMASRKGTIEAAYDASAGTPVNVVTKLNDLAAASKKVGDEAIKPALAGAKPVDISSSLTAIDGILKPGVLKVGDSVPLTAVKKELENIRKSLRTSKEYDANDLHSFQSGLRKTAERLLKSATGNDKEVGQALMNVRNNLVSDIDKAAGGKYKPALNSYREEMHIADAFRDGYDGVFSNSKKMENRPEFTEAWFNKLTDYEKEAAKEGARTAIGTEIGVAKNGALAGESLARSDFNKEKLEILFGKDEAKKLIKALEDERAIANTHNKIVEGSQTAMRTASKSQFALPTKTEVMQSAPAVAATEAASYFMGGVPGAGAALLGGAKAVAMGKDAIKMKLAREHNAQYAKLALPTEGPSRDALIASLEAAIPGPKQSLITRSANALSRIVSP